MEHGVEKVSVEAIGATADVARSTFFDHFKSKEDALTPDPPWRPEELAAAVRERPPDEAPLTAVAEVLAGAARRLDEEGSRPYWPEFFRRNPGFVPPHDPALTWVLVDAVTGRTGDADHAELVAAVAMAAFCTTRRRCARDGEALEPALRRVLGSLAFGQSEKEER